MSLTNLIRRLIPGSLKNFIRARTPLGKVSSLLSPYLPEALCIDVGASYYPHIKWLMFLNSPKTYWLAVEPNEKNLSYVQSWKWSSKVFTCTKGLSKEGGQQTLYITNLDSGSSLLAPEIPKSMQYRVKDLSYFFPVTERQIDTLSLMQAIENTPKDSPIFIKLDTQGTELSILQGAGRLFQEHRIVGVEMESTMLAEPLMKGSGKFWQACEFMEQQGFELLHIKPIHAPKNHRQFIQNKTLTYLNECDAVFSLRQDIVASLDPKYHVSLFAFYLTYFFFEEALSLLEQDKQLQGYLIDRGCKLNVLTHTIRSQV